MQPLQETSQVVQTESEEIKVLESLQLVLQVPLSSTPTEHLVHPFELELVQLKQSVVS